MNGTELVAAATTRLHSLTSHRIDARASPLVPSEADTFLVTPNDPPELGSRWQLSRIDQLAARWLIQGTWVFDDRLDPDVVRAGLARVLDDYPLLCGRIVRPSSIEYRGDGIPFAIQRREGSVTDLDERCTNVDRFADKRSLWRIARGRAPLATVRLTRLSDGWVLAVCCSHACVDGYGFYSFVQNWSLASRGRDFPQPVLERPPEPRIRPAAEVVRAVRAAGWSAITLLDGLRYAFAYPRMSKRILAARFSKDALARYRQELATESNRPELSTNTALLAHVGHCLAQLLELRTELAITLVIDQRERVPSVPERLARNAAAIVAIDGIAPNASRGQIAARIHDGLAPYVQRPSDALEGLADLTTEAAHHGLRLAAFPIRRMLGRRPSLLYTNSFMKFPIYDVDFGTRPLRVIPHNLGDPVLSWPAPPDRGGVELYLGGALARAVIASPSSSLEL